MFKKFYVNILEDSSDRNIYLPIIDLKEMLKYLRNRNTICKSKKG